jgi:uncharacterized protein
MSIDIDRPSTWIPYRPSMCSDCRASCCTMPVEVRVEDFVTLGVAGPEETTGSLKPLAKRLMREGLIESFRASTGLFMLAHRTNGDCHFLDAISRRCTVYEKRPQVCRLFPERMGPKLGFCPKVSNSQETGRARLTR